MSARALILLGLTGCGDNLAPYVEAARFHVVANPQLDILFVINNEIETQGEKVDLGNATPTLRDVLGQLDAMPSLHIGVTSPDMGTTTFDGTVAPPKGQVGQGGCAGAGADGLFQSDGLQTDARFLVEDNGVVNANLPLADTLAAMIEQNAAATGCGVQQAFNAMRRALTNPENGAFVRPTANLAVVLVGDEDDCSVADPAFFGGSFPQSINLGCARAGLICDQDLVSPGGKSHCHSKPTSGQLESVASYAEFLRELKPDPGQVAVASIVGAARLKITAGGFLDDVCKRSSTSIEAAPAVRDAELAGLFDGVVESICPVDLSSAMRGVGHALKRLVKDPCMNDDVSDTCTATLDGFELPSCPHAGTCFSIVEDLRACPDSEMHRRITLEGDDAGEVVVRCATP